MGALPRPDVPPGPTRVLFGALHELHHRAGWPSLRDMSRDVGCSHTTISAAFTGPRAPRWGLLELIVETLGGDTGDFHRLWLDATGTRPVAPAAPASGPVPSATAPIPRQLPAGVVGFTGRAAQLDELARVLAQDAGGIRLGVVSGTAGVGKTALAVQFAHQVAELFPDGQLYVNLRGYDPDSPLHPDEALESFLRALGVDGASLPMSSAERAARWRSAVAGRRILVLLDNANSIDQVRDLLPGDASSFVLVTSRDTLPGLVARHGARRIGLDLLQETDAVELLRTLVGRRVDEGPDAARALVQRAVRLPLALRIVAELALAREHDALTDLVAEFDDEADRLNLLSAGDDRYTAVRAVFSWSQRQLDDDGQRAFALLGVHPGIDIDEHAAAALLGAPVRDARRTMATLARAHLIDERRRGRFSMHDLLRAYSAELASALDADDRNQGVVRLFDHYLTSASTVDRTAVGYAWLEAERANLLAVAAAARAMWPGHTVGIADAMARFLDTCAYYSDALALDEMALDAARSSGDSVGEATALNLLGSVEHRLEHYGQARTLHAQALAIHRELGDRAGEATALQGLGIIALRVGDYAESAASLAQARDTFRDLADAVGEGRVLYVLGIALLKCGRFADAGVELATAVEINARMGERTSEGRALNNLGEVHLRLGRLDEASECYLSSFAIARELNNRVGEGVALVNLGAVDVRRGRHAEALAHYDESLVICRDVGYRIGEADALSGRGTVLSALGRHDEAVACLAEALAISQTIGEADSETLARLGQGGVFAAAGRRTEAVDAYRAALALTERTADRYEQVRVHRGLADVLAAFDLAGAEAHRRAAEVTMADLGLDPISW